MRRHLAAPTGVGRLADPSGVGSAGSASCGDLVRIEIDVDRGILREARFQAYGCPATIAGASELIGRIEGRPVLEAAALSEASIARSLGLSARKRACSNLAVDALHGALEAATGRYPALVPEQERGIDERGVLVGMSGGVDSATAALRLREAGYRVVGVTFRLWSDPTCASGRGCCSPETIQSARRTAHALGLPHLTVDLGARFVEEVVDPFVREYAAGRTPNPCVRCNAGLRFAELAGVADRLGLRWISTGHYARMAGVPPRLRRGLDQAKDQSYVLAQVHPRLLERARFPLGELTKAQTRALAREAGLDVHDSAESQEICFIPDNDYRRFLRERLGERPGAIVDLEGAEIGRHKGTYNYTVGQRRGLGIAAPEPLYVRATVPSERVVVVGSAEALQVATVVANEVVVHRHPIPYEGSLQLRSSGLVATAQVHFDESEGAATFALAAPMSGVAAGQAAVLYDRDAVVLAGTICATGKTR
ncbi:MAG: tRNA 2-thiouridine(34) synthase MnmA [Thermoleophilia bacterium]|nr:tRNA 2-thiouridine(34) synthase MnmA [Thermoleophilia bacterium]